MIQLELTQEELRELTQLVMWADDQDCPYFSVDLQDKIYNLYQSTQQEKQA